MLETEKKAYEAPKVETVEVLEQAALSCGHEACANPWITFKDMCSICGFNDS